MNITTADDWKRGASKGDLGTESTAGYSATIGYQPSNLRYEIEAGMANPDTSKGATNGDITASKLMANAIYEFPSSYSVKPFLGAGLGLVRANVDATNTATISGTDTNAAYQLIGGVNFGEVVPQTDLSLAYKYLDTFTNFELGTTEFEYNAHSIEAGAKFRF